MGTVLQKFTGNGDREDDTSTSTRGRGFSITPQNFGDGRNWIGSWGASSVWP